MASPANLQRPAAPFGSAEAPRRRIWRLVAIAGGIVMIAVAGLTLRELRTIEEIDLVYDVPEDAIPKIEETSTMTASDRRNFFRRHFILEFQECRDRFIGLDQMLLEPRSAFDPIFEDRMGRRKSSDPIGARAGIESCRSQLIALSDKHGVSKVRRALQWRYGSAGEFARYYWQKGITGLGLGLALGIPVAVFAVVIRGIAKRINHRPVATAPQPASN